MVAAIAFGQNVNTSKSLDGFDPDKFVASMYNAHPQLNLKELFTYETAKCDDTLSTYMEKFQFFFAKKLPDPYFDSCKDMLDVGYLKADAKWFEKVAQTIYDV